MIDTEEYADDKEIEKDAHCSIHEVHQLRDYLEPSDDIQYSFDQKTLAHIRGLVQEAYQKSHVKGRIPTIADNVLQKLYAHRQYIDDNKRTTDRKLQQDLSMMHNEMEIIEGLHQAISQVPSQAVSSNTMAQMEDSIMKRQDNIARAYKLAMSYYAIHARIILSTFRSGTQPYLGPWKPDIAFHEEASQPTEAEAVATTSRIIGSLYAIALYGDNKQLPPVMVAEKSNEYILQGGLSLSERLQANGAAQVWLVRQYRMAPQIGSLVSKLVYGNKLINDISDMNNCMSDQFKDWSYTYGLARKETSILLFGVKPSPPLQIQCGSTSKVNFGYIAVDMMVVKSLIQQGGFLASDILVITFYQAQVKEIKRSFCRDFLLKDVEVSTVDGVLGHEKPVVILDVVTPGGERGSEGFCFRPRRMNVALSRAKNGLVIVGSSRMANIPGKQSAGRKLVASAIDTISKAQGIVAISGPSGYLPGTPRSVRKQYQLCSYRGPGETHSPMGDDDTGFRVVGREEATLTEWLRFT